MFQVKEERVQMPWGRNLSAGVRSSKQASVAAAEKVGEWQEGPPEGREEAG